MFDSTTWWVNQGRSFGPEFAQQIIFAGTDKQKLRHHLVLGDMNEGDVTLHYADRLVRAIGLVRVAAITTLRPYVEPTIPADMGLLVGVDYFPLSEPIHKDEFPDGREGIGPFDRRGIVKVQYCNELPDSWGNRFRSTFQNRWPRESPWSA